MPCRDYESDYSSNWDRERYKAQADKLARIACAAMEELVRQGKADFLVLKNEEVRDWWEAHVKADRAEKARIAEQERRERVKREALDRLTDEEKELLGLKKPVAKKHKKFSPKEPEVVMDYDEWVKESEIEDMVKDLNKTYLEVTEAKYRWKGD